MLSMRLHEPGRALVRDEADAPHAGPGEVLIEVAACGVCGQARRMRRVRRHSYE